MKKQENLELLKKLANTKVDTSIMRSSKNLGMRKDSRRAILAQALQSQRAGLVRDGDYEILYDRGPSLDQSPGSASSSSDSDEPAVAHKSVSLTASTEVGKGLKRPLEFDSIGAPIIKKRQRTNKRMTHQYLDDESSWNGFCSGSEEESPSESDLRSRSDFGGQTDMESETESDTSLENAVSAFPFANKSTAHIPRGRPVLRASSDFKTWATQKINEARDFTPTNVISVTEMLSKKPPSRPLSLRPPENDSLPPELIVKADAPQRRAYSVPVLRPNEVQEERLKLPIVADEQKIMEAIHNNPIVIICGSTGSGKTTQIPQFLYEAGYGSADGPTPGLIGVTQPRRVAAVTMARRVGEELCNTAASSYQIRFDSNLGRQTKILFQTDGILIRELSKDFALTKYSVIVIDEAHERSVNTDILIGMVSRIVSLRADMSRDDPEIKPLKLIIMSATLMVDAFTKNSNLFRDGLPPLVESEGRQYPVTIHFARRTQRDYLEEVYRKILRGHRKLPPGGMLGEF